MNRIVTGHEAHVMLAKAISDGHDLKGLVISYELIRWRITHSAVMFGAPGVEITRCRRYGTDLRLHVHTFDDSLCFYLNDLTSKTSAGAGQGSTHKPDGEINMSQNTTARLFAIATFNLGDVVSKGGKQYLVAGMHGYYNSARIGQGYASDDPTSIPPTTAPSIDYTILSKDGKTSLVKKGELTLVERYESIHDKLRIGTQAAFDSARAELEEVKADFIEVVVPVAPAAAPVAVAAVLEGDHEVFRAMVPGLGGRTVTVLADSREALAAAVAKLA